MNAWYQYIMSITASKPYLIGIKIVRLNIYLHLVDITRWENLVHPSHYLGQFHPNITLTLEQFYLVMEVLG